MHVRSKEWCMPSDVVAPFANHAMGREAAWVSHNHLAFAKDVYRCLVVEGRIDPPGGPVLSVLFKSTLCAGSVSGIALLPNLFVKATQKVARSEHPTPD